MGIRAYAAFVRVIGILRWHDTLAERLVRSGWEVDDLDFERMAVIGDFHDLESATSAAARDLPAGVPVSHPGGGFIVGHEGVAPRPGGLLPAYVLWPDGEERLVETRDELARALRDRLDWQCERARAKGLEGVEAGRERALRAIDAVAAGGELTNEARGPVFHSACATCVEPVARLRWDGFRYGWQRVEGRPAEERRPPCYQFEGAFAEVWRDAFRAGEEAAREHLTASERTALAPELTEERLRDRWIDDPDVRAWSRHVNTDVATRLREIGRLQKEGEANATRAAVAALRARLTTVIAEAEADERPAANKMTLSLRRLAASTERLANELAARGS